MGGRVWIGGAGPLHQQGSLLPAVGDGAVAALALVLDIGQIHVIGMQVGPLPGEARLTRNLPGSRPVDIRVRAVQAAAVGRLAPGAVEQERLRAAVGARWLGPTSLRWQSVQFIGVSFTSPEPEAKVIIRPGVVVRGV